MFVGWRITGWGTSYFATPTICTRFDTSLNFKNRNWFRVFTPLFVIVGVFGGVFCMLVLLFKDVMCGLKRLVRCLSSTGQLVWRRHIRTPRPSHHALRATCMQLLPIVEVYCKWELEEDCTSLRALMLRFDSESELELHELGRSLLFMVRDDDGGMESFPLQERLVSPSNPFDVFRERLAAADVAIQALHVQVHLVPNNTYKQILPRSFVVAFTYPLSSYLAFPLHCFWLSHGCFTICIILQMDPHCLEIVFSSISPAILTDIVFKIYIKVGD